MPRTLTLALSGLTAFAFTTTRISAQDVTHTPNLIVKTLCFESPSNTPTLFLKHGETYEEVELPLNNFSQDYKTQLADDGKIRFYIQNPSAERAKVTYSEIVSGTVPIDSYREMLALLLPTGNKQKPFTCIMISFAVESDFSGSPQ